MSKLPIFRESDLEDNSLWVLEKEDTVCFIVNCKKIYLSKQKVKELKHSLEFWLANQALFDNGDTDPAPHHGCQCQCHNLIDYSNCLNCKHDTE